MSDIVRKRLLERFPADQEGAWEIRGEDENAELAGHHHMPTLAVVVGRYDAVVEQALQMPRFFYWGSGGDIRPVKLLDLNELAELTALEQERESLQARLRDLDREIDKRKREDR